MESEWELLANTAAPTRTTPGAPSSHSTREAQSFRICAKVSFPKLVADLISSSSRDEEMRTYYCWARTLEQYLLYRLVKITSTLPMPAHETVACTLCEK